MRIRACFVYLLLVFVSFFSFAQQPDAVHETPDAVSTDSARVRDGGAVVPHFMRYSGVIRDDAGNTRTGVVGLTFAIYDQNEGGATIWQETQNVTLDDAGRYNVLLGATKSRGLPMEPFASGDARFIGVRVVEENAVEQPRVRLVSVPYALAAGDAQSLGGRPVTDFALTKAAALASGDATQAAPGTDPMVTSGTAGFIGKFTNTTDLGNSIMFDTGANIGIGTSNPTDTLQVVGAIRFGSGTFVAGQAKLFTSAQHGTLLTANTGSSNDIAIVAASGNLLLTNPTGTNNLVMLSGGGFGVNTSVITEKLTVNGGIQFGPSSFSAGAPTLYKDSAHGSVLTASQGSSNDLALVSRVGNLLLTNPTGTNNLSFFSGGNFGINTLTPSQRLEVAGTIYSSSGGFRFPDGSTQTTAAACSTNCTGTISAVTAGSGLTGGGTTGAVTLNANLAASGGDGGAATTIARGDHVHDARYLNLTGGTLTGALVLNRTESASNLNEIRFADNGQIRSLDNNHRLVFDRTGNALELRDFGEIILSPGATAGNRTSKARFFADGSSLQTGAKGTFTLLADNAPSNGKVLLNTLLSTSADGPQERYAVNSIFEFVDVGMDAAHNYVIEIQDTPALTVKRDLTVVVPGKMRLGLESEGRPLTTSDDVQSIVVRRVGVDTKANGFVVAVVKVTDTVNVKLVRDGSNGGMKITMSEINPNQSIACMGVTNTGAVVGKYGLLDSSGVLQIWTDAQNVVYFQCSFGDPFNNKHITQITMHRQEGDYFWMGYLTSSTNQ